MALGAGHTPDLVEPKGESLTLSGQKRTNIICYQVLKGIGLKELPLVFSLLGVYFTLMTLHSILYMPRYTHTAPLSLLLKPGS